jgi:uncharacterized membrane protein
MRRLAAVIFRSFLQGMLILCPIGATGYIIYLVFDSVDSLVPYMPVRGLGFLIIIAFVTVIGYLGTRLFLGRMLIDAFDHLIKHTPGVKHLYSSLKDVMDSFVGDKKRFNKPVWVCTNRNPEVWRIGFLTQEDLTPLGLTDSVSVYLPHSYAISGYVVMVSRELVKPVVGMNAAEAMKFAVSGGIAGQEEDLKVKSGSVKISG